ncbi:hypothetical protein FBUS_02752 [Fasciolopsis buskii]|uniref:Uncharacterized protein n=1 Tax=Fasciolopsis buskii TaxID=27845 RepID=A0A8E0S1C8_9TREM|nr:hypothetical protein FBUS_02752 [Fasciolopsis buski]
MTDPSLTNTDKSNPNNEVDSARDDDTCCKHAHDCDTEAELALRLPGSGLCTDTSPQQLNSYNGQQQYHHRRKRIRISPLARVSGDPRGQSESSINTLTRYTSVCNDIDTSQEMRSIIQPSIPSQSQSSAMESVETNSIASLISTRMDSELQSIILKYVRLKSVIRCLELAGFCSPFVLACLDEAQIQRLEDFVGHTCSLIDSPEIREQFLGPIFGKYPEQFRLPAGTVCGLMLASADIKRRYRRLTAVPPELTPPCPSSIDIHHTDMDYINEHGFADMASQTEISVPPGMTKPLQFLSESDIPTMPLTPVTSASPVLPTSNPSVSNALATCPPTVTSYVDPVNVPQLNPLITSIDHSATPNTVAMMAAAFQAAAVVASGSGYTQALSKSSGLLAPSSSSSSTSSASQPSNQFIPTSPLSHTTSSVATALNGAFPTDPSTVITTVQNAARLVAAVSGCTIQNSLQSLTSVVGSNNNSVGTQGLMYDEEVIDLERLKQHSSASAVRLASRQFINAHLIRGRDFDMEMEISVTPEGLKRVTGIFYCHLCREKRERTSAVRFSIARNRYPVLSNVLSHLKTHFQYRGQLFHMQPNAQSVPQVKPSYCLNDSLLNVPPGTGNGLSAVSPSPVAGGPLDALGLNLNTRYSDLVNAPTDLVGGNRIFLNPCANSISQSNLVIKDEALDVAVSDPRIPDDTGANSSGSDTRASLSSERSTPPPPPQSSSRNTSVNLVPSGPTPTINETNEGVANCELISENGLSLDLFSTPSGNGNVILPR